MKEMSENETQEIPFIWRPLTWEKPFKAKYPTRSDVNACIMIGGIGTLFFLLAFIGSFFAYLPPIVAQGVSGEATISAIEPSRQRNNCQFYQVSYHFETSVHVGGDSNYELRSFEGQDEASDCNYSLALNATIPITYVGSNPSKNMIGAPVNTLDEAPGVLSVFACFIFLSVYLLWGGLALRKLVGKSKRKNEEVIG